MGQSCQWNDDSYIQIDFFEPVPENEFSVKLYGDSNNVSFQVPGGVISFEIDRSLVPDDIANHCNLIGLMYRLKQVPKIIYLNGTTLEFKDDSWDGTLPTPLHSNDAIVTEL